MTTVTLSPVYDTEVSSRVESDAYLTAAQGATPAAYIRLFETELLYLGQYWSGVYTECMEGLLSFDTSSIPDNAVIDSVTLELYGDPLSRLTTDFILEARAYDFGDTAEASDWISYADLLDYPLLATFDTTGWSTSGYNALTENGSFFRDWINPYGNTRILLNSSRHRMAMAPSETPNDEYLTFNSYRTDDVPTFKDPKLTITYTEMLEVGGGEFVGNSGFSIGTGQNCISISADTWRDTTLRITLEADEFAGATNIQVKMTNGSCVLEDEDNPPSEDILVLYNISTLAAGEIFVIDGRRREITVEDPATFRIDGGLPRLTGNQIFRWPDLAACQVGCVCITVEAGSARVAIDSFNREL